MEENEISGDFGNRAARHHTVVCRLELSVICMSVSHGHETHGSPEAAFRHGLFLVCNPGILRLISRLSFFDPVNHFQIPMPSTYTLDVCSFVERLLIDVILING